MLEDYQAEYFLLLQSFDYKFIDCVKRGTCKFLYWSKYELMIKEKKL